MSSGSSLWPLLADDAFSPTSNYASFGARGNANVPILAFDDTTSETAYFLGVLPQSYSGNGLTLLLDWVTASAIAGTVGWLVSFARLNPSNQDLDALVFSSTTTVVAVTVPGSTGVIAQSTVLVTAGANMDSIGAGDLFVLAVARDTASDTAVGDAQLLGGEIRET